MYKHPYKLLLRHFVALSVNLTLFINDVEVFPAWDQTVINASLFSPTDSERVIFLKV
jgi:hypothetical protein